MKRMSFLTPALSLLLVWLMASPAAADPWSIFGRRTERGSGDIVTEEREADQFERIRLACSADLTITFSDHYKVTVTTDDNLQDNIFTEVVGRRTLLVDVEDSFRSRRGVLVEITMPVLKQLEVDGSGDVEIKSMKTEALEIELDGSGDIEFDGEIGDLEITVSGSGDITAYDLTAEEVRITIRGSGDIELQGTAQTMDCAVHGSGSIKARRLLADRVDVRVHGSGDISVYAESAFDGGVYGSGDIDVYGNPEDMQRHVAGSGDINRRR